MEYKEISLNGLGEITTRDIVNALMDKVEPLYDSFRVAKCGTPYTDIELYYGNKHGYETFEIDLILDRNIQPFYVNIENIQDKDTRNEYSPFYDKLEEKVNKLFLAELKKLNKLYKKRKHKG